MMNYAHSISARKHDMFSYHPMPFYDDMNNQHTFNKKLDLNLYCIKRPKQTCFIQVTNPNLLAWGIELGDLMVVEQNDHFSLGDLLVLEQAQQFHLYELADSNEQGFLLISLDSKIPNVTINHLSDLAIKGIVTNIIHQIRPERSHNIKARLSEVAY